MSATAGQVRKPLANGVRYIHTRVPRLLAARVQLARRGAGLDGEAMATTVTRKSILLVEDDVDLVRLTTQWLEHEGYRVRSVAGGHAALAALAADPLPDLVLLDIKIPHVTGLDVLRRLRTDARTRTLPVVMMTGLTSEKDVKRGRLLGANDYIVKPLTELDFLKRVARALGEQRTAEK